MAIAKANKRRTDVREVTVDLELFTRKTRYFPSIATDPSKIMSLAKIHVTFVTRLIWQDCKLNSAMQKK